ncbi:MAG TPA: Mur ligase family protein, partial [Hyphomonadaceae bacterium]|nr:Mur ligase family protein [Hyphomonadaceae bacterium]
MVDPNPSPLWTSEEAAAATDGKALGTWAINGISIDTRSLKPGDLFVALKDVRDGHDFVANAFSAGAEAALVSRDVLGGHPGLMVHDVLHGLEKLGLAARTRNSGVISAITGSVGKTSVKEMLARIFRAAGRAHWSDKSFNNHWGVPLTLARMPRETERAIFEIGMNTPGEIGPRSLMVRP